MYLDSPGGLCAILPVISSIWGDIYVDPAINPYGYRLRWCRPFDDREWLTPGYVWVVTEPTLAGSSPPRFLASLVATRLLIAIVFVNPIGPRCDNRKGTHPATGLWSANPP